MKLVLVCDCGQCFGGTNSPNISGLCQCNCGRRTSISPTNSKRLGRVKGEHMQFINGHGHSNSRVPGYKKAHRQKNDRTYNSWKNAKARCHNSNATGYEHYGALGVIMCERWHTYENFLADMGERPPGTSLGRWGDTGNYEPGNCAWMTPAEQAEQKRIKRAAKLAAAA